MEFNEDGSLKILKQNTSNIIEKDVELFEEDSPSRVVLKLIEELDFPVGRKMVSSILKGEADTKIKKFRFNFCENFGALDLYDSTDIYELIDNMMNEGLIEIQKTRSSKYFPVVCITDIGKKELRTPSIVKNKTEINSKKELFKNSPITDEEKKIFSGFGKFLEKFNEQQKKAIVCNDEKILCVAGAGSGKTTVLTKRIEYLNRIKGVESKDILAITFTRKARQEMISRLSNINVEIETFNSFCEKLMKKYEDLFYSETYRVMDFKQRIRVFHEALGRQGYTPEAAIEKYYRSQSRRGKEPKSLFFGMMNDIFSLIDHYKNNMREISLFKEAIVSKSNSKDMPVALFVYNMIQEIERLKVSYGLRDYTDQIVHAIQLFEKHSEVIPKYKHILVDEYQDVNDIQVKLLNLLSPNSLFVVGDPRQSIYGWRGSKIKNILSFPELHEDCAVVQLTKNYRSTKKIVGAANKIIKPFGFPEIESALDNETKTEDNEENEVVLIKHADEKAEHIFVAQSIIATSTPREQIFILARTNKQIESIREIFANYGIKHIAKTGDDVNTDSESSKEGYVTISTVHAIKGLEADIVYVIGTNTKMYPCLVSEHPVQDLARVDFDYDKYDEEMRLLYVAVTRARRKVFINYSGRLSKFITEEVQSKIKIVNTLTQTTLNSADNSKSIIFDKIREWRKEKAVKKNLPAFMILKDRSIHQIERENPKTKEELENILGYAKREYVNEIYDLL